MAYDGIEGVLYNSIINMHLYTHIHAEYILTQWRRTTQFLEKYTSHFIWKGSKRVYCRGSWRLNRTAIYWPPLLWPSVFLSRSPDAAQLEAHSAGCRLPLPHLVTNGSGLQTHWLPVFTELYNSSITHSISLEWYVWSSSSGNNGHAVHRSLSSSASVYNCTMGFYLVPYCQPSPPTRFLPITAIGMCHFLPVHHFGMACLAGSKVNIQQVEVGFKHLWPMTEWF